MRSATAFLPSSIMTLTNLETSTLPYSGSGTLSRLGTSRRRGMFHLTVFSARGPAAGRRVAIRLAVRGDDGNRRLLGAPFAIEGPRRGIRNEKARAHPFRLAPRPGLPSPRRGGDAALQIGRAHV